MSLEKRAYTPEEAAQALGVTVPYVKWLIRSGKLRGVRLGYRTLRIPVEAVEELLRG